MAELYRVIWKHYVLNNDIASFVLRAMEQRHDVDAISISMEKIDQLLSTRPKECGESRGPHERILIIDPLAVDFEVYDDEKIVYIARARYAPKKIPCPFSTPPPAGTAVRRTSPTATAGSSAPGRSAPSGRRTAGCARGSCWKARCTAGSTR